MLQGTVIEDPGGGPVRKAIIQVIPQDRAESELHSAVSDRDGHFRLGSLAPGRYRLFVERTGFVQVDPRGHHSPGTEVTLRPGQPGQDIVLRVRPTAAISGRVVDEEGDPMANVEISVLRFGYSSCHRRLETERSERTNDLGEYRIGGLLSGRYFIAASAPEDYSSLGGARDQPAAAAQPDMAYATTYYPGTADRNQAVPLELHPGDHSTIDFSLAPSHTYRVQGTVVASPGLSAAEKKGTVMLRPKDSEATFNAAEVDKEGNFEIRGVSPGSYAIWFMSDGGDVPAIAESVEVKSSDINNLHLRSTPAAQVRGQIRMERSGKLDLAALTLYLHPLNPESYIAALGSDQARTSRDGTFVLDKVLPGNYDIEVVGSNPVINYFVKSTVADGRELPGSNLRINGGLLTLAVVISANTARIDGTVINDDSQPVANATVVAVPDPQHRLGIRRYPSALSDQAGHFQLDGLRPDQYTIFAWEEVESGAWCTPDFLKAYEGAGQQVRLDEGARKNLVIKVIGNAN